MVQIQENNLSFQFLHVSWRTQPVPVFTEVTKFIEAPVSTARVEFTAESFSVVGFLQS